MEFTLEEMRTHLAALEAKISTACKIAGRSRESVKLVWVSKFHPAEAVENAISLGATDFGENRVQEAELKFSTPRMALDGSRVRCHVIGPVQSNKLKKAAIVADCNAGEEETKSGLDVHEAEAYLNGLAARGETAFPHLRFRGLMTIGKNTGVAEDSRECFAFLRNLQQKFLAKGGIFANFDQLSMGMTGDLEVAIEEGSTMIRVGTALFGERDYSKPVNDPV